MRVGQAPFILSRSKYQLWNLFKYKKCCYLILSFINPNRVKCWGKSWTAALAGSHRFTETAASVKLHQIPWVNLNIVTVWMITEVRSAAMPRKTSHPVKHHSQLSGSWSDSTVPQAFSDYIGLARGARSIINKESCQSLLSRPDNAGLAAMFRLLWHGFRKK